MVTFLQTLIVLGAIGVTLWTYIIWLALQNRKERVELLGSMRNRIRRSLGLDGKWTRNYALVIGTTVFLFGLGLAFWTGFQAHSMTNEDPPLDREFDMYQALTVIGIMIASIGIGLVTCELVFENYENDARMIPRFVAVIGAVVSSFGLGTALWAGLAIIHMGMLPEAEYESLQRWCIIGFWAGSLGVAVTAYGLASSTKTHARKRPRT